MVNKPIKRNKNIIPLSKDHHDGLLLCWKIRQGLKMNIEFRRIQSYINFFWRTHLADHFRQEEELLFSRTDGAMCDQAKDEHRLIRLLIADINSRDNDSAECYSRFANLLEQHIRYEERVLFPYLEENLSVSELETIGKELEKTSHSNDVYEDEFWLKKKTAGAE